MVAFALRTIANRDHGAPTRTRRQAFGELSGNGAAFIINTSMHQTLNERVVDSNPQETAEWVEALDQIMEAGRTGSRGVSSGSAQ